MSSRYDNKRVIINNSEMYRNVFKGRGLNYIRQYLTPIFKYPTAEELGEIEEIGYIWGVGDRLWKLSQKYYGDPSYWYIIAAYNLTHEMFIKNGDVIYVPTPLSKILDILEV
jgi:hypothetical protein